MKKYAISVSISKRLKRILLGCLLIGGMGLGSLAMNQDGGSENPKEPVRFSSISHVDLSPIRGDVRPLRLRRSGFEYACSECHRIFDSPRRLEPRVAEHTDLVLNHGSNNYCLNCHHKTNRDAYTDHDGSEIPADQPVRLCAKCHGPTYRDWLVGAHGRWGGTWNPASPYVKPLLCIQCHDPHSPKFPKLQPMPGPAHGRVHSSGGDR